MDEDHKLLLENILFKLDEIRNAVLELKRTPTPTQVTTHTKRSLFVCHKCGNNQYKVVESNVDMSYCDKCSHPMYIEYVYS